MKRFIIRAFFIMTILLFGILFGIYQAHLGPLSKYNNNESQETIEVAKQVEKKEIEVNVESTQQNAETTETEDVELEKKQEQAEAVSAFNFYSELGSSIGDVVQTLFSSLISMIVGTLHGLLHP